MNNEFDKWFDENFPKEKFGNLDGIFRDALKTDIALKAFKFGLREGFACVMDTDKCVIVSEYLKDV